MQTDEKQIYVKGAKIAGLIRNICPLFLWDKLRPQIIPQFNMYQITLKTAICNKQVAVFLLPKYLYFRPIILKTSSLFLHFLLDKPYSLQLLKFSPGCRSPPLFWFFKLKNQNGGFNYEDN